MRGVWYEVIEERVNIMGRIRINARAVGPKYFKVVWTRGMDG